MSNIYDYDLFISCAHEDKDSAQFLSRKLQELDFVAWPYNPEVQEVLFTEKLQEVIETSAVCVLLLGAREELPWSDDSVRAAIQSRLDRTHDGFRIITVILPGVPANSAVKLLGMMKALFINHRQPWATIRFKNSLNEEDVINDLILRIRGIDPDDQSDWLEGSLRKIVRLRAQNALSVDWRKLVFDLYSAPSDSSEQKERIVTPPENFNTRIEMGYRTPGARSRPGEYNSTYNFTRHHKTGLLPGPDVQGESTPTRVSQWDDRVRQTLRRRLHPQKGTSALYAPLLKYGPKIVTGTLMLFISVLGYSWIDQNEERGTSIRPNINVEATHTLPPTEYNHADPYSEAKVDERAQSWESNKVRDSKHSQVSHSLIRRDAGTRVMASTTPRSLVAPSTGLARIAPPHRAKIVKDSQLEESPRVEIPNQSEAQYRTTAARLAQIKRIYVKDLDNANLSESARISLRSEFIKKLREDGAEVVSNIGDIHDGVAELKCGPQEIRRGVIYVNLLDNKKQVIDSWPASTKCGGLCKKALDQLAGKMNAALQEAQLNSNKKDPGSSSAHTNVTPES